MFDTKKSRRLLAAVTLAGALLAPGALAEDPAYTDPRTSPYPEISDEIYREWMDRKYSDFLSRNDPYDGVGGPSRIPGIHEFARQKKEAAERASKKAADDAAAKAAKEAAEEKAAQTARDGVSDSSDLGPAPALVHGPGETPAPESYASWVHRSIEDVTDFMTETVTLGAYKRTPWGVELRHPGTSIPLFGPPPTMRDILEEGVSGEARNPENSLPVGGSSSGLFGLGGEDLGDFGPRSGTSPQELAPAVPAIASSATPGDPGFLKYLISLLEERNRQADEYEAPDRDQAHLRGRMLVRLREGAAAVEKYLAPRHWVSPEQEAAESSPPSQARFPGEARLVRAVVARIQLDAISRAGWFRQTLESHLVANDSTAHSTLVYASYTLGKAEEAAREAYEVYEVGAREAGVADRIEAELARSQS